MTYPKTIYIIRHAEETGDKDDQHLSDQGWRRAYALKGLFGPVGRLAGVQFLIATDRSKHSNRCVETLMPLSEALGLEINHGYDDDEYRDLAKRIKSGKKYNGAVILVAWHHGFIPKLAKALGIKAKDLPRKDWPDSVYDWVWIISYDDQGGAAIRQELQAADL